MKGGSTWIDEQVGRGEFGGHAEAAMSGERSEFSGGAGTDWLALWEARAEAPKSREELWNTPSTQFSGFLHIPK